MITYIPQKNVHQLITEELNSQLFIIKANFGKQQLITLVLKKVLVGAQTYFFSTTKTDGSLVGQEEAYMYTAGNVKNLKGELL